MKHSLSLSLALLALMLGGCSLMPRYERPPMAVSEAWNDDAAPTAGNSLPAASEIPWQAFITDPHLQEIIQLALDSNRDLRIATLNVEKVQALYGIQRSDRFPNLGVMATGDVYRLPAKMSENGRAETVEQYSVQIGTLSWELDLFGRVKSLETAALERWLASGEAQVASHMSLVAGTAVSYLNLAADRESLVLARESLASYESAANLIHHSHEAGVASAYDLAQARTQVEAARAAVAQFKGRVALDRNALELLVGSPIPEELIPGSLHRSIVAGELAAGMPSEVLLGRPDILMAEHQLKDANAQIGAARAAFFPRISLTAGAGTMSTELSGLFGSGSGTWSFAPQIVAPIFAGGALRGQLAASEIEREIAVARYEKAIQNAFREVKDALVLRVSLEEQLAAQQALVDELATTQKLAALRYEEGMEGYLGVLVTRQVYFAAKQTEIAVRLAEESNLVTLYKALGGGRSSEPRTEDRPEEY